MIIVIMIIVIMIIVIMIIMIIMIIIIIMIIMIIIIMIIFERIFEIFLTIFLSTPSGQLTKDASSTWYYYESLQ